MTFSAWLTEVDNTLVRVAGGSRHDFSDWDWRNAFDSGKTPHQAVAAFLRHIGAK